MRSRWIAGAPIVALAVAVACRSDGSLPVTPGATTSFRVVHGAAGTIDVVVDGQAVTRSVAPASVVPLVAVSAGTHQVEFRPAGGAAVLARLSLTATAGRTQTIATVSETGGHFTAFALSDTGAAPVAGRSKLRIVHLAANAPPMRAWRVQPDYPNRVGVMFPFPYRSESGYLQSTPGAWEVSVTRHDGGGDEPGTWSAAAVLAAIGPIPIEGGQVRTVVVLDRPGGGVTLELLEDG